MKARTQTAPKCKGGKRKETHLIKVPLVVLVVVELIKLVVIVLVVAVHYLVLERLAREVVDGTGDDLRESVSLSV
jgi:hypothetical protein